jgi:hypothetical protein
MRRRRLAVALVVTAVAVGGCSDGDDDAAPASTTTTTTVNQHLAMATRVAELVTQERWAELRRDFDERMLQEVTEARLIEVWGQAEAEGGQVLDIGEPSFAGRDQANVAYDVLLQLERIKARMRVAFDQVGRISGLFILRAQVTPETP